jgi:autotransporter family porin
MFRSMRRTLVLLTAAILGTVTDMRDATAGCAVVTAGTFVCDASTAPEPAGPQAFPAGSNVTVNSGTLGAFNLPSGSNTLIFGLGGGAPVIAGSVLFGTGADRMEVHSGTITGNVNQGQGVDTFIMTGGVVASLDQSDQLDTAIISGGTIIGVFANGDFVTITGGTIGAVDLNVANNVFTMSGGTILGNVTAEQNNDTFLLTGGSIGGLVDLGSGTDTFTWSGGGTIAGAIMLGAGNDAATLQNLTAANLIMPLMDGGTGTDQLTFDNVVTSGVGRFVNWETINLINGTQLTLDANLILGDSGTGIGTLSIDPTSTLFAGGGVNPSILPFAAGKLVTVTNAGLIDLTNGGSGVTDTLTIAGNYVGSGGRLALQTVLGGDGSPSDRLVVSGAGATGSGSTSIAVTNVGGAGALTLVDGIQVVQAANGATTQPGAFMQAGPIAAGRSSTSCSREA